MPRLKPLLALIILYLNLVRAVNTGSPLLILPGNNTAASTLLPYGASNLSAPFSPPEFEPKLTFWDDIPIRPIEIYINAVEMMTEFSQRGWNSYIEKSIGLTGDHFLSEVVVFPLLPGTGPESWLPIKYAISALYTAGVAVANSQRSFCQLKVELFVKGAGGSETRVGMLQFRPKMKPEPPSDLQSYLTVDSNVTATDYSNVSVVGGPPIRIWDQLNRQFYLTFNWNGHSIKAQNLFTSILNALAIASVHDNAGTGAYVPNAPSASGDVTLTTWTHDGPSAEMLTWERMKRFIQLVWEGIIIGGGMNEGKKARFEDFTFALWYIPDGREGVKGDLIGGGRMWKFDAVGGGGNGTAGTAVS